MDLLYLHLRTVTLTRVLQYPYSLLLGSCFWVWSKVKVLIVSEFSAKHRPYSSHRTDSWQDSVFVLSYVMEMILGISPREDPSRKCVCTRY